MGSIPGEGIKLLDATELPSPDHAPPRKIPPPPNATKILGAATKIRHSQINVLKKKIAEEKTQVRQGVGQWQRRNSRWRCCAGRMVDGGNSWGALPQLSRLARWVLIQTQEEWGQERSQRMAGGQKPAAGPEERGGLSRPWFPSPGARQSWAESAGSVNGEKLSWAGSLLNHHSHGDWVRRTKKGTVALESEEHHLLRLPAPGAQAQGRRGEVAIVWKHRASLNSTLVKPLVASQSQALGKIPQKRLAFHQEAKELRVGKGSTLPRGQRALPKIAVSKLVGWMFLLLNFLSFPLPSLELMFLWRGSPRNRLNTWGSYASFCYLPHCCRQELQQMRQMCVTTAWTQGCENLGQGLGGEGKSREQGWELTMQPELRLI